LKALNTNETMCLNSREKCFKDVDNNKEKIVIQFSNDGIKNIVDKIDVTTEELLKFFDFITYGIHETLKLNCGLSKNDLDNFKQKSMGKLKALGLDLEKMNLISSKLTPENNQGSGQKDPQEAPQAQPSK
jgi:hypothetical protein